IDSVKKSIIFHAGTTKEDNRLLTAGGRVMCVTALGKSKQDALSTAYNDIAQIQFDDMYYRHDIGLDI
ncbi:MAG: phosphoribosylamine--glycine ligase, partial [Flavobacteriales bacterium]|nr:phosphoribosylamine--glycine ligase [Flavobacteriales bacterium]